MKFFKKYLVKGEFFEKSESYLKVFSPQTLEEIASIPIVGEREIIGLYNNLNVIQKEWEKLGLNKRIEIIKRWIKNIEDNSEEIINITSLETAKTKVETKVELARSIENGKVILEEAKRIKPKAYDGSLFKVKNKLGIFSRVAKGNVLVISPFNYPISTPLSKIISALVTGNSVVFKPSTQGSLVALFLGKLTSDVGFPKGIINIVTGRGSEISNLILKNNVFNVVTFTGSTKVGKLISEKVTKTELILELGGKDTSLVLDDVEVEEVSTKLIKGAFQFSGQRCTAVKRVLVTEKVADQLVESLKEKIKELSSSEIKLKELIVPLISLKSANYAFSLIEDAGKQKADVIVGGQQKANFLYPTLIDHVNLKMKIAHEEQFAPIIPVIRIKSWEEGVQIINASNYALQASIFTKDLNLGYKIAEKLDVGTVNLNEVSSRSPDNFPFLGVKDSGLGCEGLTELLYAFTRPKGIVFNWKN